MLQRSIIRRAAVVAAGERPLPPFVPLTPSHEDYLAAKAGTASQKDEFIEASQADQAEDRAAWDELFAYEARQGRMLSVKERIIFILAFRATRATLMDAMSADLTDEEAPLSIEPPIADTTATTPIADSTTTATSPGDPGHTPRILIIGRRSFDGPTNFKLHERAVAMVNDFADVFKKDGYSFLLDAESWHVDYEIVTGSAAAEMLETPDGRKYQPLWDPSLSRFAQADGIVLMGRDPISDVIEVFVYMLRHARPWVTVLWLLDNGHGLIKREVHTVDSLLAQIMGKEPAFGAILGALLFGKGRRSLMGLSTAFIDMAARYECFRKLIAEYAEPVQGPDGGLTTVVGAQRGWGIAEILKDDREEGRDLVTMLVSRAAAANTTGLEVAASQQVAPRRRGWGSKRQPDDVFYADAIAKASKLHASQAVANARQYAKFCSRPFDKVDEDRVRDRVAQKVWTEEEAIDFLRRKREAGHKSDARAAAKRAAAKQATSSSVKNAAAGEKE